MYLEVLKNVGLLWGWILMKGEKLGKNREENPNNIIF
jgi:hypothetical protein